MTKYVAVTQPIIEKVAHQEATGMDKAAAAVDAMIKQGLLSAHLRDAKIRELTSNPGAAYDCIVKTAGLVSAGTMGGPVSQDASSNSNPSEANAAFERKLFGR
jgi:hypothetical protein